MQTEHDHPPPSNAIGPGDEDRIEIERIDRAWQRQIDAEDADGVRGSLRSAPTVRWVLLAIAGVCGAILVLQRLQ